MSERAVRLLQGYLWLPRELDWEAELELPATLRLAEGAVSVLLDEIEPPFAFFDDGTPSASQRFYQLTVVALTEREPAELHGWVQEAREALEPQLEASPAGVGWLVLEDLREL